MKNVAIPILVALIFIVMGIYLVTYQVRETESVFITRFGKPVREKTEPGLGWKWPTPIESVHRFDSRMRVLESNRLSETPTRGSTPIIVNTYVVWRIAEPLTFLNAFRGGVPDAESKLRDQINDTQNRIIGQHWFGDFVNSDPNRVVLETIQDEMLSDLQSPVQRYGIEIKTLGIKQLKVSEDVTKSVFDRMRADRTRRTDTTISQGQAEADKIKAEANNKRDVLLAAAEARGKAIRGQGDAEAATYYEMLEEAPGLAMFLRNLETLLTTLKERATLVIRADTEPFKYLKEMPVLEPEK